MEIHFSKREYAQRKRATLDAMTERGLDGLIMFRQESMYYLTGLHSCGYVFFQCVYLSASGDMTLLTRLPDVHAAELTSILTDRREWRNLPDANPADDLRGILLEHGANGKRIGIELDAYGLTAYNYRRVDAALNSFCRLEDASDLITKLRVVKSPKELTYCRRAGRLADDALRQAQNLSIAGADEGEVLAAMQGAVFKGGGDYASHEFIVNSGARARFGRYVTGRRKLSSQDQLTLEWAGAYRFYHAAMMRTLIIGKAGRVQRRLHDVALEVHQASVDKLRPGNTFGDVYDAYASVSRKRRVGYLGATGYGLGATFPPTWMDWPMFWHGNDEPIREGMVLFIHTILMTTDEQHAQAPGQTFVVTRTGADSLSSLPMELIVNN